MASEKKAASISIEGNAAVNRDILVSAAKVAAELEKFGLDVRPGYGLAPALGGALMGSPPRITGTGGNVALASIAQPVSP